MPDFGESVGRITAWVKKNPLIAAGAVGGVAVIALLAKRSASGEDSGEDTGLAGGLGGDASSSGTGETVPAPTGPVVIPGFPPSYYPPPLYYDTTPTTTPGAPKSGGSALASLLGIPTTESPKGLLKPAAASTPSSASLLGIGTSPLVRESIKSPSLANPSLAYSLGLTAAQSTTLRWASTTGQRLTQQAAHYLGARGPESLRVLTASAMRWRGSAQNQYYARQAAAARARAAYASWLSRVRSGSVSRTYTRTEEARNQ